MYPNAFIISIWRKNLCKIILLFRYVKRNLLVAWLHISVFWKQPNLKQLSLLVSIGVKLTMLNTRSSTHHLNIARFYRSRIAHAVFVC